jgi:hypothetical protein
MSVNLLLRHERTCSVCCVNVEGEHLKYLHYLCFFVKVATNLKSTDTNRANASYMLTLLRAFFKLFVALLFIYLFI